MGAFLGFHTIYFRCIGTVVLAATLGWEGDRMLRECSVRDMAKGVIMQATLAAYLEESLDGLQEQIKKAYAEKGLYLRSRYSPGYGDFPISLQKKVLEWTQAPKRIGLTVTESCMLSPTKSVTAFIGFSPGKKNVWQKANVRHVKIEIVHLERSRRCRF